MKPYLRSEIPTTFDKVPEATAFEAGYLVTKNAGWRNIRPIVDTEKCKGCGICAKICKFESIKMESER